ncbi:hypothetical protein A7A78_10530 [Aequorivita soesokkakensis]|uniref:Integral membrane protein n=1 Tax=Aequorivita soesokkakensis TaxID=1385699 RepID=A0A1A9LF62_9FLAO|nr:hypothetical protein A7A78_10530 [Aequorivita soesokkakensis]
MALYAIVFILSLIKYPVYKNTSLKFLPLIFLLTLVAESMGMFINKVYESPNSVIYNIYYFFYFTFFFYLFMKVINVKKYKNYIKIGIVIFWLFYLRDLFFTDIFNESFIESYIVGAGLLIYCIILYYISILQSSKVLVIKNDLLFWISVGLFLFYIGYLPIKIIRSWFYKENSFFWILLIIQFSLVIVMYLCFLTGFLWMKKKS